jgi:hypothetical protein
MPGHNNWIDLQVNSSGAYCNLDFRNFNPIPKKDAIEYTINQITKKYDNLFVAMSGGIGSEFVAKSLHNHGVKFTPMIIDFELNSAEIWHAYQWCYENNITPVVNKLSLDIMINQMPQIARYFNTQYISTLEFLIEKYVSRRYGHVLTGGLSPFTQIPIFKDRLGVPLSHDLNICSYDFGLPLAFGDTHPTSFIAHTPELFYSFIRDVDYSKPTQLAISEYFEVSPRPQFDQEYNFLLSPELAKVSRNVNSTSRLYNFYIGQKDTFLESAGRKEVVPCKTTIIK